MVTFAFLSPLSLPQRAPARSLVCRRAPRGAVRAAPCAKLSVPPPDALLRRARDDTLLVLTLAPKALATLALIAALWLPFDAAQAASGGRVGGSSFRSAPPSRVAPAPRYGGGYSGGYGYGGGFGYGMPGGIYMSPIIMPFGGFGLGGFGSLILFGTAAAFVYDAVRTRSEQSEFEEATDPTTVVTSLKIALLANARELQLALDNVARSADTSTVSGLKYVLEETVMALLRHPDYWMYGSIYSKQSKLSGAESSFSRLVLEERLKLDEETLSNSGGRVRESAAASASESDLSQSPGEYIVVNVLTAATDLRADALPQRIGDTRDVKSALRALAGVRADALQAVEVIWAPQSARDTLSQQQLLRDHPELQRL
eukprot:TRINITY_DN124_c0_g1_i1.p2 TRINITY_DN124_c0_g1~~TRINITY_DN124_c0_g1_i1.p2  ORF type:complete len:371 (-),score=106.72 TRINITY_DN124_c0_g1_i1:7736-8848(-)